VLEGRREGERAVGPVVVGRYRRRGASARGARRTTCGEGEVAGDEGEGLCEQERRRSQRPAQEECGRGRGSGREGEGEGEGERERSAPEPFPRDRLALLALRAARSLAPVSLSVSGPRTVPAPARRTRRASPAQRLALGPVGRLGSAMRRSRYQLSRKLLGCSMSGRRAEMARGRRRAGVTVGAQEEGRPRRGRRERGLGPRRGGRGSARAREDDRRAQRRRTAAAWARSTSARQSRARATASPAAPTAQTPAASASCRAATCTLPTPSAPTGPRPARWPARQARPTCAARVRRAHGSAAPPPPLRARVREHSRRTSSSRATCGSSAASPGRVPGRGGSSSGRGERGREGGRGRRRYGRDGAKWRGRGCRCEKSKGGAAPRMAEGARPARRRVGPTRARRARHARPPPAAPRAHVPTAYVRARAGADPWSTSSSARRPSRRAARTARRAAAFARRLALRASRLARRLPAPVTGTCGDGGSTCRRQDKSSAPEGKKEGRRQLGRSNSASEVVEAVDVVAERGMCAGRSGR